MTTSSAENARATSRVLRIFFSCTVCLVAAVMLAGVWSSDMDAHYTHRAGSPLFILFFLFPVVGFVILGSSALFFWFDELGDKHGPPPAVATVAVLTALVIGVVLARDSFLLSAAFIYLLLYWLMTGRVVGRPGWSIRRFRSSPWDEKVFLIVMVCLVAPPAYRTLATAPYGLLPFDAGTPPFRVEYDRDLTTAVKRAARRFPDPQSCLDDGADAGLREDLVRMDWDRIWTDSEATVCIFRLLHASGDISHASDWLAAQEFRAGNGFNSERPHEDLDGTLRVTGLWSVRENGPRFPTRGVIRRALRGTPYGMSVDASYSADGQELLHVRIGYSTL